MPFSLKPVVIRRRWLGRAGTSRRRRQFVGLTFESLENRRALSANVWTGHAASVYQDDNWSNGDNWTEGTPEDGQDLEFPPAGAATYVPTEAVVNDLPELSLNSIELDGPGYTLNGNALTLTGETGIVTTYGGIGASTALNLDFNLPQSHISVGFGGALNINGTVSGPSQTVVSGGGFLSGTGHVTNLALIGTELEPGDGGVGFFESDGGATLYRGSIYRAAIDISGNANSFVVPGGPHETVNLQTPVLAFDWLDLQAPAPPPGSSITIINGQIQGAFANLPEGAQVPGTPYRISYQNGVVLSVPDPTAIQLTETHGAASIVFGQSVTFQSTVNAAAGTPAGQLSFEVDGNLADTETLDSSGVATFTTSSLSVGPHVITAIYAGNTKYSASTSGGFQETVQKSATVSTIHSSDNQLEFGLPVTLQATVAALAPGAGIPSGTVAFYDGSTIIGTAPVLEGHASLTTSVLALGAHSLSAVYTGDSNFSTSTSPALAESIDPAKTTVALTANASSAGFEQNIEFDVFVSPADSQSGTPTGRFVLFDGPTELAGGELDQGEGVIDAAFETLGDHAITAEYVGDHNFLASTSLPVHVTINPAPTTVALTFDPDPSALGEPVAFTAQVTSPVFALDPQPTGTVTFSEGTNDLATVPLNGEYATWTSPPLTGGSHHFTATFHSDKPEYSDSSALAGSDVGETAVDVSSNSNPGTFGQTINLSASVLPFGGVRFNPTGSVRFMDGATALGTAQLDASHAAAISVVLASGHHAITAVYSGDSHYIESASHAIDQVVDPARTSTSLSSSATNSPFGAEVFFTANVNSSSGEPAGSLTFRDGNEDLLKVTLDASGSATFSTHDLAIGVHHIVAVFGADTSFAASSSAAIELQVTRRASAITLTSTPTSALANQMIVLTAHVSSNDAGAGEPTGQVVFRDGPTVLGTSTITAGLAQLQVALATVASPHQIEASFAGNDVFAPSMSSIHFVAISPAATTSILAALPRYVHKKLTKVVLSIIVQPQAGATLAPTGMVTVESNGFPLRRLTLSHGSASLVLTARQTKNKTFVAQYSGDADDQPSRSKAIRIRATKL